MILERFCDDAWPVYDLVMALMGNDRLFVFVRFGGARRTALPYSCSSPLARPAAMHPFFGRLVVFFVLCLISFIAYSSQIFIVWPWYGREVSVQLLALLVPFKYVARFPFSHT
jgi:hypothetical protein